MADKDKALAKPLDDKELIAKIALTGNLAPLSDEQRWQYYQAYCQYLGLDPITKPFDLLTTTEKDGSKKTVLYANAGCASQIADNRGVTYGKPEIEYSETIGTLTVWVKASLPSGREQWNNGVIHVQALAGKSLENAIKKATTQAHRRATLALCGISMPDESEIEDIAGAQTAQISSGQTAPQWVAKEEIHEILEPAREKLAEVKAQQSGAASKPQAFGPQNRAHSEEAGKRFDSVIHRLVGFGVQGRDLLNEVNSVIKREEDQIIETRYELTDNEVARVCEVFEAWAAKLEAKAAKKTEL
jgi:hypothetical protein